MTQANDFIVPPRSWPEIGGIADNLRHNLGLANEPHLPVIELIEQVLDQKLELLRLEVGDRAEMCGAEGLTCPNGDFIMLRDDVYEGVWAGQARPRFTTAHELGHWVMHTNISMARSQRGDGTPHFRLAEPQANQFAAEILMPEQFITAMDQEDDLIRRFNVSWDAARNRLLYLHKKGRL
ncbi:ImmA/IrrE family metallo-endopeptidase [Ruegeria arenilitoris]|uniref:ImmA/IrrE family metallo-endopeptidase n=1 Tax=Ruegeria arenilitoris TaxID=1173585 RepID=UPI0014812ECB|nr:ImmA/IrrE family metallo-endopeptidase [Ruegeria arenilitoris]